MNPIPLLNTLIMAALAGLIGWYAQDMRKRMANVERRLGATVRALFYWTQTERRILPHEVRTALEEAMRDVK